MKQNEIKPILLEEALDFIGSVPLNARKKIYYNIYKVLGGKPDPELFKKLQQDIWEFRTLYNHTAYRLLAFWDKEENTFVVATHGFIKKTQKTPEAEIEHAVHLRAKYFEDKKKK